MNPLNLVLVLAAALAGGWIRAVSAIPRSLVNSQPVLLSDLPYSAC
jgi:ABC-type thiamine transport system ATPase subunit